MDVFEEAKKMLEELKIDTVRAIYRGSLADIPGVQSSGGELELYDSKKSLDNLPKIKTINIYVDTLRGMLTESDKRCLDFNLDEKSIINGIFASEKKLKEIDKIAKKYGWKFYENIDEYAESLEK